MMTTSLANSLPGENLLSGRRAQSKLPAKTARHEKVPAWFDSPLLLRADFLFLSTKLPLILT
jgi:hypothetical protein